MRVKVGEALKCTVGNSSYFHLLKRLFMHCWIKRKYFTVGKYHNPEI